MDSKIINLDLMINGLNTKAEYYAEDVNDIFIPLLQRLTKIQKEAGRRIVVYLAAPPGLGKSTLAAFLEMLSKDAKSGDEGISEIGNVQAAGMDGFHHYGEYLKTHKTMRDGKEITLDEIKGAPETFDTKRLVEYIERLLTETEILWPTYDRTKHDVVDDGYILDGDIIILEGNYFLLNDERWEALRQYAAYTIYAYTDIEVLKPRLIQRKVMSGHELSEAEAFYEFSDGRNARLVLEEMPNADLYLKYENGRWIESSSSHDS